VLEAARVLARDGRFCVCVTHPISDSGCFASRDPEAPFVISGSYLGKRPFEGTFQRNGLSMTFRGWVYALEGYARAFEDAGLLIEAVREPAARPGSGSDNERWRRLPNFLMLRLCRPTTPA
jgi:hypothetical protein